MEFFFFSVCLKDGSYYEGVKLVDHPQPKKVAQKYFRRFKKRFGRRLHSCGITHSELSGMFHKRSGKLLFQKFQKLKRACAVDTHVAGRKSRITDGKAALPVGVLLERTRNLHNYREYLQQEVEKEKQARALRRKERLAANSQA